MCSSDLVNADDAEVGTLLRALTFLDRAEIEELEAAQKANPEARVAQKALARELTLLVHGKDGLEAATRASEILFGGSLEGVSEEDFQEVVGEAPTKDLEKTKLASPGVPLVDLLVHAGLCPSKSQARKDVEGGGIYINNERISEFARGVTTADLLFGKFVLLRKGKRTYAVVNVRS